MKYLENILLHGLEIQNPHNIFHTPGKICYMRNFNAIDITDLADNVFVTDANITEKLSLVKKFFGYRSKKFLGVSVVFVDKKLLFVAEMEINPLSSL